MKLINRQEWSLLMTARWSMLILVALFLAVSTAFSAPVTIEKAESVARKHLERKRMSKAVGGGGGGGDKIRRGAAHRTKTSFTPYYVFEKEGSGFVIVSADDVAAPILGETDSGVFDADSMPPALVWLLGTYERQIEEAVRSGKAQDSETRMMWEQSAQSSGLSKAAASYPSQLLSTTWNQEAPYNLKVLEVTGRKYTGCVATAMAQIMKYWKHPAYGTGASVAYTTRTDGINIPSVNFDTYYNYANMLNDYPSASSGTAAQREAVSTFMYHSGVSVWMDYTDNGSGAYSYEVATALPKYFGYDYSIRYVYSLNSKGILANDWKDLVIGQIENNSPVLYGGQPDSGKSGHAFIIDGYNNSTDRFHLNWGWGGHYDGSFALTALNPGTRQYNYGQGMIINIMPNQNGNPPSQIKVTDFGISTTQTALNASIKAKMYYGADFSGKIGFAVMSGGAVSTVLDSADYSIVNAYNSSTGYYTVNYENANLSKRLSADMPYGNLTLQTVTKRGTGNWTPVGETRTIFIPRIYEIMYIYNYGTVESANPVIYTAETASFTLNNPIRPGYTFMGWTGTNGEIPQTTVSVSRGSAGDRIYTANWKIIKYPVTFDANGGTVAYDVDTTGDGWRLASLPTPVREGYTFVGWFKNRTDGEEVTTNTAFSADATIYARWTLSIYTITFNANGGTVTPGAGMTGEGWTLAFLPTPTRKDYAFDGWFTAAANVEVTTRYVFGENTVVYAKWTPLYAVTFDAGQNGTLRATVDGNAITTGALVRHGKNILFTVYPTVGYSVSGWTVNGRSVTDTADTYALTDISESATVSVSFNKLDVVFSVGPNPASGLSGPIRFFRFGVHIESATLYVYDVVGNAVRKIEIEKDIGGNLSAASAKSKRLIGSWDLKDAYGRPVPAGTYLVKGIIKASDGKDEKVSAVVGVGVR